MVKSNNSFTNQQIARLSRTKVKMLKGRVVALSPQGDILYCVVRRPDTISVDKDGNQIKTKGTLFGNEGKISEDEITLQEVLIESNLHLGHTFFDIKKLLGVEVMVEMLDGSPKLVHLKPSAPSSRAIPSSDIWRARSTNSGRSLHHKKAKDLLLKIGYTEQQINDVINETFGDMKPEGQVLRYGNVASWQLASSVNPEGKDISTDVSIVTNLPARTLKSKDCHRPGLAFTGK